MRARGTRSALGTGTDAGPGLPPHRHLASELVPLHGARGHDRDPVGV